MAIPRDRRESRTTGLSAFATVGVACTLLVSSVQAGPADCNGNGVDDTLDIKRGTSADCQGDGIPDECQIEPVALAYRHDMGLGAQIGAVGTNLGPTQTIAWLSRHHVDATNPIINGFQIIWGVLPVGYPATVGVWSDPNGDGDPADAQLIASVQTAVESPWVPATIIDIPFPETFLGEPGTSFFLGAWVEGVADFPDGIPAVYDPAATAGESWWIASLFQFDPNDLATNAAEYGLLSTVIPGLQGDWYLRGTFCASGHCGESADLDGNGIPDECDPDCNGNGLPDGYDIAQGSATDCDASGVPDSCEGLVDCDANDVPDACQQGTTGLVGQYYLGTELAGTPLGRIDATVNFVFETAPDVPPGYPNDNISVRWTGTLIAPVSGTYEIGLRHDDGVRLWLDGRQLIDLWQGSGGNVDTVLHDFTADEPVHIRVEYYEGGGYALCDLLWRPPGATELAVIPTEALRPIYDRDGDGVPDLCGDADCNANFIPDSADLLIGASTDCDGNGELDDCQTTGDCDADGLIDACQAAALQGVTGEYYFSYNPVNGTLQSGRTTERAGTRIDANIDFDWSGTTPGIGGLNGDYYTVRWRGTITTPAADGVYTFVVGRDDGARLWIDDELVIDEWVDGNTSSQGTIALAGATTYRFRLEVFNGIGGGRAILGWIPPGGVYEVIPSEAFRPIDDVDGNGIPDACDADCDGDGIADDLAIASGLDEDCNGNGVPDSCDIAAIPAEPEVLAYWRFESSKSLGVDSGPNGLAATPAGAVAGADRPVAVLPLTGAPNAGSAEFSGAATMTVQDASGVLSLGAQAFTVEAWVRVDQLGTASAAGRQWIFARKPSLNSDALLDWGFLAQAGDFGTTTNPNNRYGKTDGYSGRELAFAFGFGSGTALVQKGILISHLEVTEAGWHHVSFAFDPARRTGRFTLDGAVEIISIDRLWIVGDPANPLVIGAHPIGTGLDGFLRGAVDEARITRGVRPLDRLLASPYAATSDDGDANGVPDECGPGCPADFDGDGLVNAADLAVVLANWGTDAADLDGDGSTGASDLAVLLDAWGACR
ncbi:MAG: hypothetical protein RLZZ238_15 [Planctomycetota bacterium]